MKTGLFAVFDSQKSKDQTAGPVFSSLGPVWLQSFCGLETRLTNTSIVHEGETTIYNAQATIDNRHMYNFPTIIHETDGTIYNGRAIIERNSRPTYAVRQ